MFVLYCDEKKLRYSEPTVVKLLQVASHDSREDDFMDIGYKGPWVFIYDKEGWVECLVDRDALDAEEAEEYKKAILDDSGVPEVLADGQYVVLFDGVQDEYILCNGDIAAEVAANALTRANEGIHAYRIVEE